MSRTDGAPPSDRNLAFQRSYFVGRHRRERIDGCRTPVVQRHLDSTLALLDLNAGDRVLELGCGSGRFTRLLLDAGLRVCAVDLSSELMRLLEERLGGHPALELCCSEAHRVAEQVHGSFDAVVGFFFLHHLVSLEPVLAAVHAVLRPGGRVAFCEPNGLNPLYYLQVTFTPGMSWRGEPGIANMRPARVLPALEACGFDELRHTAHGFLPPRMALTSWGRAVERSLERASFLAGLRAYRVFSGRAA